MAQGLQNWRKGVNPHEDIRENKVTETLFAVNLSRAISRKGASEYREPKLFFERTYLTRTLKGLILDVLNILRGQPGANSILHLQTNFGGGKTHAELALYHLLTSPEQALSVPHLAEFLKENGITTIPKASVAALPCTDLNPHGREVEGGLKIYTIWGEIAFRLGGVDLYNLVRGNDQSRTSPGVEDLRKMLVQAGPNIILIDELLHYVDKAAAVPVADSNLGSQTIAFLREFTEAVDQVDHSVLVASLTASDMEGITVLTEQQAISALSQLEDILRRLEDVRIPVESAEIYEIARLRLFQSVSTEMAQHAAEAYSQMYRSSPWKDQLPPESREAGYDGLLLRAFPFHPSIIKVLYERWGSRPKFQLTRGTLRFLSHLLAHLWNKSSDHAQGPLIHLSDIDLSDDDIRAEALKVAGNAWEAVIGTDIAAWEGSESIWEPGESLSQRIDRDRGGLYERYKLTQGIAASVFMFTHGGIQSRSTPEAEVRLAVAHPGIPLPDLNQAMDECANHLYFYYKEDGGLIFKTEPNPNKVLADERSNVQSEEARRKLEGLISDALGNTDLFRVSFYGFFNSPVKEPGDVPDEGKLQMVILPPRRTMLQGKLDSKLTEFMGEITENYGKRHRMNRNMVLFMAPDAGNIASAIERAMDWLAAEHVLEDASLLSRFSESQREYIQDQRTIARNDTRDYIRKAYRTVAAPNGETKSYDVIDLSYVPPNKTVLQQAQEDLINNGKIHSDFNPALLDSRWVELWPKTATVITTQTLWEKFSRRSGAPIFTGIDVLQQTIRRGVEKNLFGFGVLTDPEQDKLDRTSYERMYFGQFDARDLGTIEISNRTLLMRADQVDAIFTPITKEEVAMMVTSPRLSVQAVFTAARISPMVIGRVDPASFFSAVAEGAKAGLFGYAESINAPVRRGADAEITPSNVSFSAILIGEDVPLPVTADELAQLVPSAGKISIQDLYNQALETYGNERVTAQTLLIALQRCIKDQRFGFADASDAAVIFDVKELTISGFVGQPEVLPPDTRQLRVSGLVSAIDLASVVKAVTNLSRLGESTITLDLRLELKGEINEHSVSVALNELRQRVAGLKIEDIKGK